MKEFLNNVNEKKREDLLPMISTSLMVIAIQGSINMVTRALRRKTAESEPMPMF